MLGFLPPSSRATFFTVAAAAAMIVRPVCRPPVKETRSTRGSVDSERARVRPGAEHQVADTGRQARLLEQPHQVDRGVGVSSLGFSTKVLPAARQGATFHETWSSG